MSAFSVTSSFARPLSKGRVVALSRLAAGPRCDRRHLRPGRHARLAARGHLLDPSLTLGTPCATALCGPGELSEPQGVAVSEATGEVYVADKGNERVDKFDPFGTFIRVFIGGLPTGAQA